MRKADSATYYHPPRAPPHLPRLPRQERADLLPSPGPDTAGLYYREMSRLTPLSARGAYKERFVATRTITVILVVGPNTWTFVIFCTTAAVFAVGRPCESTPARVFFPTISSKLGERQLSGSRHG